MIDAATQKALGLALRRRYEAEPKGGIPDHLWSLLLQLEAVGDRQHGREHGAASDGERPSSGSSWLQVSRSAPCSSLAA